MTLLTALAADGRPRWLRRELAVYPGRDFFALRVALACMLTVAAAMTLSVPETAVSCYLVLYATREDAAATIVNGLRLIAGAAAGVAVGALVMRFSAEEPLARTSLMILFTVVGMYLASATTLGSMASTAGFVLALAVTLFDIVPLPELMVRGALYMWEAVAVPMVAVIVVAAFGAPRAHVLLRRAAAARIEAAAALLRGAPDAMARARALLGPEAAKARERERTAWLFYSGDAHYRTRILALLDTSYALLAALAWSGAGADLRPERAAALAVRLDRVAMAATEVRASPPPRRDPPHLEDADLIATLVGDAEAAVAPGFVARPGPPHREPFFHADAFDNPDHLRFGLKTALAAFVCYAIYTGLDWFNIHTAMVTCYFVALSSVGETVHKLTLRIVGCLIGAGLGVFAIVVLMPVMTDIGQLAAMVGAVAFVAAWIAAGSPRISYMGWQIAFAFFLCTLNSFGPSFDLIEARDRVLGILLGNLVMTVVFTSVWPVGVQRAVGRSVAAAARALSRFADPASGATGDDAERFGVAIAEARRVGELRAFERDAAALDDRALDVAAAEEDGLERLAGALVAAQRAPDGAALDEFLPEAAHCAEATFRREVSGWLAGYASRIEGGSAVADSRWRSAPGAVLAAVAASGVAVPVSFAAALARRDAADGLIDAGIRRLDEAG
jgi:multidrug resistance protein MdtO